MSKEQQYVLRTVEERGVRFIRLWFTDILGFLKSFAITPAELETAFDEGMRFDGSAIDGFSRRHETEMLASPDPTTFQILPWRDGDAGVARMFCNIVTPEGEPFAGDPRWVLSRNLERAHQLGYTFYVGPEIEYFYFRDSSPEPEVLDRGGYFDLTPLDVAQEYRRRTIITLERLGIPVESSHHEVSPSQHELDLRHTDALTMADNIMTTRLAVKEVAMEHDIYATFMPKPLEAYDGSGMHLHLSLFQDDQNVFYEEGAEYNLSKVGRSFIAGLLHHGREITAVTNQWVNSYKRLVTGFDAPVYEQWGRHDQSAVVLVPAAKRGKPQSSRIEYRSPDGACNPYLAFSLILAAGLAGIENGYELPEGADDGPEMAAGVHRLPSNLAEALDEMERSDLARATLGEHVYEWFLRNKREEWERYQSHVSQFELKAYLPVL
ncbi:MAG TPA: glutamine synthetase family protein [Acidimicrobiia bacterium]|jgi:glutamine synthetase|nr:glutamine synthetase family protein [Acidimicrobiia bacterium]